MGAKPDFLRKRYAPLLKRGPEQALMQLFAKQFPRLGGPRIRQMLARLVLELLAEQQRPSETVLHGQVLWLAVAREEKPYWGQSAEQTLFRAVLLELVTHEDVEALLRREPPRQRRLKRCLRLCRQALEQGALLGNCDLAMLLGVNDSQIAAQLAEHERLSGEIVPRRATLQDVGSGLTHKRWICRLYYLEGKTSEQIAELTHHSIEAVDRYLGQFDRVRQCLRQGLDEAQTAYILRCLPSLVREYARLDEEITREQKQRQDNEPKGEKR